MLKFASYLDRNREQLISEVVYFEGEKDGIPVEVSMTYNTSYTENIQAYVNNINTYEGGTHLSGFRRGLTNTLKKYAAESGMLTKEKIEIVDHEEIFRDNIEFLPTFNIRSIDALLFKIKDLSEKFIYFNDDATLSRCIINWL